MTALKYCGIRRADDAKLALELGATHLGFNFYPPSPRYIEPAAAAEIVRALPAKAECVGVFVDLPVAEVKKVARTVALSALQFHGAEGADYLREFPEWTVIRALSLKDQRSVELAVRAAEDAEFLLIDAWSAALKGGTGTVIAEELLGAFSASGLFSKTFLAGGLTAENVQQRISNYRPYGVDVASGIESAPGVKDSARMRAFAAAVLRP